jgi:hypothetical protein
MPVQMTPLSDRLLVKPLVEDKVGALTLPPPQSWQPCRTAAMSVLLTC